VSLRKGLQRLEGVAQSKLIVKPPHMEVRMKPGFWPDLAAMQRTLKEAGYTPMPENVGLLVTGKVVRQGERLEIALDRMRAPMTLGIVAAKEDPETAVHLERHVGETVELEGLWQPAPPGQPGPGALAVTAIRVVEGVKP
jgi:hypothetical protein